MEIHLKNGEMIQENATVSVDFHCRVNFTRYRRKFSWLYVRKQNRKRRMHGMRKRKKVKRCSTFYIYVRGSHIASNVAVRETGTNSVRYNFRDNCFCLREAGPKNHLMPVSLIPVAEPTRMTRTGLKSDRGTM